jgi:hypothetical protein
LLPLLLLIPTLILVRKLLYISPVPAHCKLLPDHSLPISSPALSPTASPLYTTAIRRLVIELETPSTRPKLAFGLLLPLVPSLSPQDPISHVFVPVALLSLPIGPADHTFLI